MSHKCLLIATPCQLGSLGPQHCPGGPNKPWGVAEDDTQLGRVGYTHREGSPQAEGFWGKDSTTREACRRKEATSL